MGKLHFTIENCQRGVHTQTHHYIAHFSFSNCLSPSTNTESKWLIFDSPAYAHTYKQTYTHPLLCIVSPISSGKTAYMSVGILKFSNVQLCYSELQIVSKRYGIIIQVKAMITVNRFLLMINTNEITQFAERKKRGFISPPIALSP